MPAFSYISEVCWSVVKVSIFLKDSFKFSLRCQSESSYSSPAVFEWNVVISYSVTLYSCL